MSNFVFGDDIIDSRDVISRLDEFQDEYDDLVFYVEAACEDLRDFEDNKPDLHDEADCKFYYNKCSELEEVVTDAEDDKTEFDQDALNNLRAFCSVGEGYSEWSSGVSLIHEDHFVEYTKQLIDDVYEMPVELDQGGWPWDHISIDYKAAAEALKQDYGTIEFEEETYYLQA